MIFAAVLPNCLKQTKIFGTDIFQDVSEDLNLSYDLISLFLFFAALYIVPNYYHQYSQKLKDFIAAPSWNSFITARH